MDKILDVMYRERDVEYAVFQQKLIPELPLERFIGVRTPVLRKLAKEFSKDQGLSQAFYKEVPHRYYEENQLHFFMVSENRDFESCIRETEAFLPYVDNWSTCDQPFPKIFVKKKMELKPYLWKWLQSGETYTIRFAVGAVMRLFLDGEYDREFMEAIADLRSTEYYVNMMTAWYFATALAKQWEETIPFLEGNRLDAWTHNKTIQKARESFRITPEQKDYLKTLKR